MENDQKKVLPNTRLLDAMATKKSLFWILARVEDTCGNYFTVSYSGDNDYHEIYPSRIDYTGNTAANLSPYASVRFSYEEMPDSANTYVYGTIVRRNHGDRYLIPITINEYVYPLMI